MRKSDKLRLAAGKPCLDFCQGSRLINRRVSQSRRPTPALRTQHGSGAFTAAVHCFRIVFSMPPRSGGMRLRKSLTV